MSERRCESRREFFKTSAIGVTGIAILSRARPAQAQPSNSAWPATGYMQINPEIDNCRVVFIQDPNMLTGTHYGNFANANNNVTNHDLVKSNLDLMARALARRNTADEAWRVILRKPTAKQWSEVLVAIKVNANQEYGPSAASVGRFCEVLIGFGVPAGNITICDGGAASGNGCPDKYRPFVGSVIPDGVQVISRGDTYGITLDGWNTESVTVVRDADILINAAVNKGHDRFNQYSGVTMCVKNHVGTINFAHRDDTSTNSLLCAYHKHEAILGNPSADVPPKQQLNFVDGLFVGQPGDWTGHVLDGDVLYQMSMGTLAGPVDYYTTKFLRIALYNDWNEPRVNEFVEGFGYTTEERIALDTMNPDTDPAGRGLVDASVVVDWPEPPPTGGTGGTGGEAGAPPDTGGSSGAAQGGTGGVQTGGTGGVIDTGGTGGGVETGGTGGVAPSGGGTSGASGAIGTGGTAPPTGGGTGGAGGAAGSAGTTAAASSDDEGGCQCQQGNGRRSRRGAWLMGMLGLAIGRMARRRRGEYDDDSD
jgi:hypothetical protein